MMFCLKCSAMDAGAILLGLLISGPGMNGPSYQKLRAVVDAGWTEVTLEPGGLRNLEGITILCGWLVLDCLRWLKMFLCVISMLL